MMIKLVLANDRLLIRKGLRQLLMLDKAIEVIAEAENEEELYSILAWQTVDVLLLDLSLCGIYKTSLLQRITVNFPSVAVLVLSMHNEPQLALSILNNGAYGFISNDQDPDALFTAIHHVAGQQRYIHPDIAEKIIFSDSEKQSGPLHRYDLLSLREKQIMQLLSEGNNSNAIATQLNISNKTVSTHKVRMMEKMKFTSNADIVRFMIKYQN